MGLDIVLYNHNKNKSAGLHWSYHTIHILRDYACTMIDAKDEDDKKAKQQFPNLVWHSDAEGYYVGFLPSDSESNPEEWNEDSQLWVGSVEGLYKELQRVSTHMIQNGYEGDAKEVLKKLLQLFADVEYEPEEDDRNMIITFS
jgi:hypothetical protein